MFVALELVLPAAEEDGFALFGQAAEAFESPQREAGPEASFLELAEPFSQIAVEAVYVKGYQKEWHYDSARNPDWRGKC